MIQARLTVNSSSAPAQLAATDDWSPAVSGLYTSREPQCRRYGHFVVVGRTDEIWLCAASCTARCGNTCLYPRPDLNGISAVAGRDWLAGDQQQDGRSDSGGRLVVPAHVRERKLKLVPAGMASVAKTLRSRRGQARPTRRPEAPAVRVRGRRAARTSSMIAREW
jgi:hypothetical protein